MIEVNYYLTVNPVVKISNYLVYYRLNITGRVQ